MKTIFVLVLKLSLTVISLYTFQLVAKQEKGKPMRQISSPKPGIVIYKMKRDYSRNVPVLLSDDKKEIVSYPHPMDLIVMTSKDVMPIRLHGGYYLDRRGINKNVAFLNISYNSYRKLRKPLSIKEIEKLITDRNPLSFFLSCSNLTYSVKIIDSINSMIDKGNISTIWQHIQLLILLIHYNHKDKVHCSMGIDSILFSSMDLLFLPEAYFGLDHSTSNSTH